MISVFYNVEHYPDPTVWAAERSIKRKARAALAARAKSKGMKRLNNRIFAIDPGTTHSGFVIVEHDGNEIVRVIHKGKLQNEALLRELPYHVGVNEIAVEMVASYGMAVGREVFETCVWIGRFLQAGGILPDNTAKHLVYRIDEKSNLCHSAKANDSNIIQALVDRYATGQPNRGKGTKKNPGFFYGFSADAWQAMAVAVTYFDTRVKSEKVGESQ